MNRSISAGLALLTLLFALPLTAARAARFDVVVDGTVVGYSTQAQQLTLNTRLGPRVFAVNATTQVLLNNHTGTLQSITAGDQAEVTYNYATATARIIHLFRETKVTGKIVSATATSINVKSNGAILSLRTDANSTVLLNGIPISNPAVLVGRKGTFVYEPGATPLLLSMSGNATAATGSLTAIDAAGRTVTLAARSPLLLALDTNATILRSGQAATLDSLVVGDRLRVSYVKTATGLRLLALEATPAGTTP